MTGLKMENLTIHHQGAALARLHGHIPPGQVLTVMGPSGSGKSTLLAALIGALPVGFSTTGHVTLNGRAVMDLPTQDRRIGLLYQDDVLFAHLSVEQNLGFGLTSGIRKAERRAHIHAMLDKIGLAGLGPRDPATLSGGQRARVALARTLLAAPEALLLDEPFSRLDQALRAQIRTLVFELAASLPVILVTHDAEDARAAGGPVVDAMGNALSL